MIEFLLPFLVVWIGYAFAKASATNIQKRMKLLLAFSGAFLLSIVVLELLPEIFGTIEVKGRFVVQKIYGLYLIGGIFLQILLEYFSRGAEHGHLHIHNQNKVPVGLFIALAIHAFLEGTAIHDHDGLLYAVAIHKLPVAIIFSGFLVQSKLKLSTSLIYIFLFSIMTPLGTFFSHEVELTQGQSHALMALAAGLMLHVSSTLIFEASENHKFNTAKVIVMLLGVVLAYFI